MSSGTDVLPSLSNVWLMTSNNPQLVATVGARIDATPELALSQLEPTSLVATADLPGQPSKPFFSSTSGRRAWFAEGQPANDQVTSQMVDACFDDPAGLRSFPGDFGFVAVDANEEIRVVRSCAGLVPWLVRHDRTGTVISTRNAWFARLLPEAPAQDLLAHLALTDGVTLVDRRTPWIGVTAVRCGHVLVCPRGGSAREVRYWNPMDNVPRFPVGTRKVEQAARDLRAALIESLDHGLSTDDVNLLGLSGGVDSSCLGALITQEVKRPVMAFTFFDASSPEDPRSLSNVRFAAMASEFTKPTHTWTSTFGHSSLMNLAGGSLRLGVPIGHPTLLALPAMAAVRRIETFVGGELADDLFAGPHVWRYDWLCSLGLVGLIRSLRTPARPINGRGLIRLWGATQAKRLLRRSPSRWHAAPLADIFRADLRAEYDDWLRRGEPSDEMHREPYRYIQSSLDADGWLLQNWELCSELGIRRVIPFVTRTMIELACSVHPSDHAFPIKRLLRLGLRDDVPEANLMRTDKGPTWSEDFFDETEVSPVVHCVLADRTIEQLEQQKGQLRLETGLAYSLQLLSVSLEAVTTK